jgi:hypothetical protein
MKVGRTAPEVVNADLLGHTPEVHAVATQGIAVVEDDGGTGCQPTDQPVPHHPAGRGMEKKALAGAHIAVQNDFFEVL